MVRAKNVVDFLKNKVDLSERVSVNACGEKSPIAVNTNANGTDNPDGRSFNRRVALIISNVPRELVVIKISDIPEALLQK